jgi:paired small multidrug resistance pump
VVAYYLTISGRLDMRRPLYSLLNAIGAALLLISLTVDFNLGATVIEGCWLAISFYGLVRSLRTCEAR